MKRQTCLPLQWYADIRRDTPMPIEYRIESKHDFLRLEVSGEWTPGQETREARAIWAKLAEACRLTEISRVIAVFDMPGRLPTMQAFDIARSPESFGWDRRWKAAIVCPYPERFENTLFSEVVAVNRGYTVKTFKDESRAQAWLLGQESSHQPLVEKAEQGGGGEKGLRIYEHNTGYLRMMDVKTRES